MKKALVEFNGLVKEVVDPGEEYEIYSGEGCAMQWVDAPDDVNIFWTLEYSPSQGKSIWVERDAPYADPILKRRIAYGPWENQLAMLYDDIKSGKLESGSWMAHCDKVKSEVPAPPEEAYAVDPHEPKPDVPDTSNLEPSANQQVILSPRDRPAWLNADGWSGPNFIV